MSRLDTAFVNRSSRLSTATQLLNVLMTWTIHIYSRVGILKTYDNSNPLSADADVCVRPSVSVLEPSSSFHTIHDRERAWLPRPICVAFRVQSGKRGCGRRCLSSFDTYCKFKKINFVLKSNGFSFFLKEDLNLPYKRGWWYIICRLPK
jgi:hypothetical protein